MTQKGNNLIIGGVHKAGTTSLYTYLSWHPEILGSEIKETHFFSSSKFKSRYESYDLYFKDYKDQKYKLEASPEYIYENLIAIENIKAQTKSPRLVFIFRDPTDKIISSFNHRKKNVLFDKPNYTFEEFQQNFLNINSLEEAHGNDSEYTRELLDGAYIDYIKNWFQNFDKESIKIIFFDDLKSDPLSVIKELCDWLEIDAGYYKNKNFTVENKSVNFKNENLQKVVSSLYMKFEPIFRKNYGLKSKLRQIYYFINAKDKDEKIEDKVLNEIEDLYKIKNKELKMFLKQKGYTQFPLWL